MPKEKGLLFLCGFMGVGKSTVATLLAKKLGGVSLDTDTIAEEKSGHSIADIFAQKGEPAFRKLESEILQQIPNEVSAAQPRVVALGGGALKDPANLAFVLTSGTLIYLSATAETLASRLEGSGLTRPLLAGLSEAEKKTKIEELLSERKFIYERAHVQIQTDGKEAETIASEIYTWYTEKAS